MPDPQTLNGTEKPRFRVTAPTDKSPNIGVYQIPRPLAGESAIADPLNFAVGVNRGFMPWNTSQLVSRKGLQIFDAMRMDDQVKAAMALKKHSVVSTGWTVTSPEEQADDWEVTEFVKSELEAMKGTLSEKLLPMLTCLEYGYSVTEMVFEDRTEGDFAGKIGLRDLKTKKPHHIDIVTDEFGNILPNGIIQETPQGPKALPVAKFILLTYQSDFGNPYGQSDLEACYRAWWAKDNSYTWLAMLLERFGIPPVFALYNSAAYKGAHIDQLKTVISRIQANTSGVIPRDAKDDLELWAPELAGQISTVFLPSLDRFDRDIARGVLMPGLLGLTSDTNQGSMARARVQFDVFMLVVEYIRAVLSETAINEQLIKPLVDLNYTVDEYPIWQLNPIGDERMLDILEQWNKLVAGGVVTTTAEDEVHIRNQVEFPERELDEIEADREAMEEEPPPQEQEEPVEDQDDPETVAENVEGEQRPPFRSSRGQNFHLPGGHEQGTHGRGRAGGFEPKAGKGLDFTTLGATPEQAAETDTRLNGAKGFGSGADAASWGKENYSDWSGNLTRQESLAVSQYKEGNDTTINGFRRKGTGGKRAEQWSENLDTALGKSSVPEDVITYRGMTTSRFAGKELTGQIISDDGYMSTTLNKRVASQFTSLPGAGQENVTLKIMVPAGTKGAYIDGFGRRSAIGKKADAFNAERELLLGRGTQLLVTRDRTVAGKREIFAMAIGQV